MDYITQADADQIITIINGYPVTYADYLDNAGIQYEVMA